MYLWTADELDGSAEYFASEGFGTYRHCSGMTVLMSESIMACSLVHSECHSYFFLPPYSERVGKVEEQRAEVAA